MIISRKKFQEEISKAVNERQEQIYREAYINDEFRRIREDISRLEIRIVELEKITNHSSITNDNSKIRPNC